ncbi:enzymatic polyprotein [Labeo rohita]|uniref:ribonuclease H n=1 Tax=Labeo rohita TaxID=84645 RepID=A0ABQ8LY94_LABRO|nr:enzymatic polyprotein [Labeo rohita]
MLTAKRILSCIRHQDWFAAIDLKDAYFHVSILPQHRPFLRFAFEGRAYQYRVLPFGLALSPRVFTKAVEGALSPLDLVLQHLSYLGFQVNQEKSRLSPVQSISFLGMELDSVNMSARLTNKRTQSVLSYLKLFSSI